MSIEIFLRETGDAAASIIEIFATQSPMLIEQMRAAGDGADTATLRAIAHKLKGSCVALGATEMASRCQELEDQAGRGTLEGAKALVSQLETALAATHEALLKELTRAEGPAFGNR
jgi:HPt (histidine-containing phosphotransfer) domain-containing protein